MTGSKKYLVGAVLVLAVIGVTTMATRARHRSALEQYRAELLAKGEKLTFGHLGLSPDPDPDNIFGQFTNAVQRLVTPKFNPGMIAYQDPTRLPRTQALWTGQELPLVNTAPGSPRAISWGDVQEQAALNRAALEEIRRLLQSPPRSISTSRSNRFHDVGNFVAKRTAAQHLAADAIAALNAGDARRVQDNLGALIHLVHLHCDELVLVNAMMRVAIGGLALDVTRETLASPEWDDADLRALAENWETIDFLDIALAGVTGERIWLAEVLQDVRREGSHKAVRDVWGLSNESLVSRAKVLPISLLFRLVLEENELLILRHRQEVLESLRKLTLDVPWPEVREELQATDTRMQGVVSGPMRLRYALAAISTGNSLRAPQFCVQRETERRLCLAALAVMRHELRHGNPPEYLEELTPEFLAAAPRDPMSGGNLRYQRLETGGYRLYSVGEDGVDNGGDNLAGGGGAGWDLVWPKLEAKRPDKADSVLQP